MSLHLYMPGGTPKELDSATWQHLFSAWQEQCSPDLMGGVLVQFVDSGSMQELSRIHQGKDEPTDVLSFTYDPPMHGSSDELVCGEIVVCTEVAQRNAEKLKVTLSVEYATLFVHGLIHLAGYDHASKEDRKQFEALTHGIMESGGLTPVSLW